MNGKPTFKGNVEMLMMDEDCDEVTNLVIIPPELDELSDNEEINEDDLFCSRLPNDVPGKIWHKFNV